MAEIYDIKSGIRRMPKNAEYSNRDTRMIAKKNDHVRRKFNPVDDVLPSLGVMGLEKAVLFKIVRALRRSRYDQIKFTHICDEMMPRSQRLKAEKEHSGGIFGVGTPMVNIVWNVRSDVGKIKVSLAEEYFRSSRT